MGNESSRLNITNRTYRAQGRDSVKQTQRITHRVFSAPPKLQHGQPMSAKQKRLAARLRAARKSAQPTSTRHANEARIARSTRKLRKHGTPQTIRGAKQDVRVIH